MPHSKQLKKIKVFPVIHWSACKKKPKIIRIFLSKNSKSSLNFSISSYPLSMLRLGLCSVFQQKVLRAVYAIPRGRVSTYQLIARQIGKPKAARAVARALATNPFPLIIPCHRVIRSDGSLGGYQGGLKIKQALLCKEANL